VRTQPDGSVAIALYENDRLIVSAVDDGSVGGAPLRNPGRVGIRGDNAQLEFDDFRVVALPAQGTSRP